MKYFIDPNNYIVYEVSMTGPSCAVIIGGGLGSISS